MKVSSLAVRELTGRLSHQGINLRIGPFVVRLRSCIPSVVKGIKLLYADYSVVPDDEFVDFHVSVTPPASLRRWFAPQVLFSFDGSVPFKPLPSSQAFPFFEWGLNWCIAQYAHQYLIIHAAVIEKNGRAVIMPGSPGAGKSTLSAALANRGWDLLSDELTLVNPQDLMLTPVPRPVSLKNESIEVIRSFAPDAVIGDAAYDTTKGTVAHMRAPSESLDRSTELASPAWIIFPKYSADASTRIEQKSKGQSFMSLAGNSFNYSVLGATAFNALGGLLDLCDCYDFTYSNLDQAISVFDELESSS